MILEKHFMVDIESTGVDLKRDSLLEIGIVEMDFVDGYWKPGAEFNMAIHYAGSPKSEFAKKHMSALYKKCNETQTMSLSHVRDKVINFFESCGKTGHEVLICGWNAANFDVPMLQAHGVLNPPGYVTGADGKDRQVGDHHYRVYEMCGAIQLACDVKSQPYEAFKDVVANAYEMELPAGKEHDAIYDCYKQIKILNGLIKVMRGIEA